MDLMITKLPLQIKALECFIALVKAAAPTDKQLEMFVIKMLPAIAKLPGLTVGGAHCINFSISTQLVNLLHGTK
jgi:hypothetical protein